MQVILLQDVKSLGKKGDMLDINDGYARNYIIPKKLGVPANEANKNDLKLHKANEAKIAKENLEAAKELAAKIEKCSVNVPIKVGENGRAFGAVTAKEISDALEKQCGIKVDKKKIQLKEAIKAVSEADVPVKLHPDVTAKLKVKVVAE